MCGGCEMGGGWEMLSITGQSLPRDTSTTWKGEHAFLVDN